jgi:hypothetical protein
MVNNLFHATRTQVQESTKLATLYVFSLDSKKLNKYSSFTDYGKVRAQTSSLVGASMPLTVVVMAIIYSLQNYQLMFFLYFVSIQTPLPGTLRCSWFNFFF